jgi:hypothetical protein
MCSCVGLKEHCYNIGKDERTTPTFFVARQILRVEQEETRHLCFCSNENCRGLKNKQTGIRPYEFYIKGLGGWSAVTRSWNFLYLPCIYQHDSPHLDYT